MWNELLKQLGIVLPELISGIKTDSREIEPFDVFVAVNQGCQYIDEALNRGALAVITETSHPAANVFQVDNSIEWLGKLAHLHVRRLNVCVIGITGSVGKTSLKHMLSQSLKVYGEVVATYENQNNELGVALTLLRATPNTRYLVVEMGVAKPGDMDVLLDIVKPDIGIVTCIGPTHLDQLLSTQGVWQEKSKLLSSSAWRVVEAKRQDNRLQKNTTTFGYFDADVLIDKKSIVVDQVRYQYEVGEGHHYRMLSYAIAHAVYQRLNLVPNFERVNWPQSRLSEYQHPSGAVIVDDCYNASLLSYHAALGYISKYPKYLVIVGEMGGLGNQTKHYHHLLGHLLNHHGIASVWMIGEAHRWTLQTYLGDIRQFQDKEALGKALEQVLYQGLYVLVKGSRHLALEEVIYV